MEKFFEFILATFAGRIVLFLMIVIGLWTYKLLA
jgi:hypothetical protein